MKQTFTKESISINDGEIEIWDGETLIGASETFLWKHVDCIILDRTEFVKPVDVEKLAHINSEKYYFSGAPKSAAFGSFMEGYNANPNEFTREDMELAFKAGCLTKTEVGWSGFGEFINNLRPLSIPEQVTIENNKVISVVWK